MSMQERYQNLKDMILSDIDTNAKTVFNGILSDDFLNRIPEDIFTQYFLPRFLGTINDNNWVLEWISIAGSPASPVIVFDRGTNQNLYKVPSLLNTNTVLVTRQKGTLKDVFVHYNQLKINIPQNATNFLNNELQNTENNILQNHNNDDCLAAWNSILARYNLLPHKPTGPDGIQEDFFEY